MGGSWDSASQRTGQGGGRGGGRGGRGGRGGGGGGGGGRGVASQGEKTSRNPDGTVILIVEAVAVDTEWCLILTVVGVVEARAVGGARDRDLHRERRERQNIGGTGIGIATIQIVVRLTDGTRIGTVMVIANETVTATGIGIRDMTHTVVVVTGRLGTTSDDELQPDAAATDSCIVCIMRMSFGVYFNPQVQPECFRHLHLDASKLFNMSPHMWLARGDIGANALRRTY